MKGIPKNFLRVELIIILIAVAVGIYAYYPTFVNKYVIADDIRVSYFWLPKFHDKALFNNDLLTRESMNRYPWGYFLLYYLSSFFSDPIFFGTALTIFLLAVCAYYLFKIGEHLSNKFLGVICALSFLATQTYIARMAGGLARSFGYPLMIMFLYYMLKKDYFKTTVAMVLQCLFYPMLFLISGLVFLFSFLGFPSRDAAAVASLAQGKNIFWQKISSYLKRLRIFDASAYKIKYFVIGMILCSAIIYGKQFLMKNPEMGEVYTRKEMVKMPEFYRGLGKWSDGLPTRTVIQEIEPEVMESNVFLAGIIRSFLTISRKNTVIAVRIFTIIMLAFFLIEILRRKIRFPKELMLLPLAGILLYKLADMLLFKLYVPNRYLIYSVQVTALIVFPMIINDLVLKAKIRNIKVFFQIIVLVFIALNFRLYRPTYLLDVSGHKPLYDFLNTLPKNTLIAANPFLADNIPLYSQRKVFIDDESAVALYKKYWQKMKKRIFGFYNFYYAEDPLKMFVFCKANNIEYIVVDKKDFSVRYLRRKRFYSEPFNSFISYIVSNRKKFVLDNIPDQLKLFNRGEIFVIHRDTLLYLSENNG